MTELLLERMARLAGLNNAPGRDGPERDEIGSETPEQQQGSAASNSPASAVQSRPVAPSQMEGNDMGRPRKAKDKPITGQVMKPDFERASAIYANDVAPANREQKRAMKEASDAWKEIKKEAFVHTSGFRTAMKVAELEEADQQAWLRSFNGGLEQRGVGLHADLVDIAEGGDKDADKPVVPVVEPARVEMPAVH